MDTESFPNALRAALRQDPDCIMVGEMRDLETVDTSLKAAETGHLVFSTIHTADVASTIGRLVSFFPTEEQLQVRARLADNLKAIMSLPQPTAFTSLMHGFDGECPCCRRRFRQA